MSDRLPTKEEVEGYIGRAKRALESGSAPKWSSIEVLGLAESFVTQSLALDEAKKKIERLKVEIDHLKIQDELHWKTRRALLKDIAAITHKGGERELLEGYDKIPCESCNGTGIGRLNDSPTCSYCNGHGHYWRERASRKEGGNG